MALVQPMTRHVPFTFSQEAEAHFRALLSYVVEVVPETADLVPVLCRGKSMTTWMWCGASALPEYSDEEYSLSFYRPEQVADYPRVRMSWAELAVYPETLEKLRGLHLELTEATDGESLSGRVVGRRY
jgi:hypothetical protein